MFFCHTVQIDIHITVIPGPNNSGPYPPDGSDLSRSVYNACYTFIGMYMLPVQL